VVGGGGEAAGEGVGLPITPKLSVQNRVWVLEVGGGGVGFVTGGFRDGGWSGRGCFG